MKLAFYLCIIGLCVGTSPTYASEQDAHIYNLSLRDLLKVKVDAPATLTKTRQRMVPAAVTTIGRDAIRQSSARSLNELLEIFVPGLQYVNHIFGFSHLGARGVMSDRDDKYLLLVNGRTMNERTVVGAITERDLNMLGDIDHIDVIRGPGSATYGVGAVSMVISIVTMDDRNFEGSELTFRSGVAGERYDTLEYKFGNNINEQRGAFAYLGISDFRGANYQDAPLRFSTSGIDKEGNILEAQSNVNLDIGNDKRQHRDVPKLKLYAQWRWDDFELWGRFTRGGEKKPGGIGNVFLLAEGDDGIGNTEPFSSTNGVQLGSQQLTVLGGYQQTVKNSWTINYKLSYDIVDYERLINADTKQTFREDEALLHVVGNWEPEHRHSVAIGVEASHEKFGLKSPGFPDEPSEIPSFSDNPNGWSTNTYSLFSEYQWNASNQVTTFISGRFDKNTYTNILASPRASLVYAAGTNDTLKWILTRSQRMNFAVDMRDEHLEKGINDTEPEVIDNIEFRWEHDYGDNISTAISNYYEKIDLIGFVESTGSNDRSQDVVAEEEQWGIEMELVFKTDKTELFISHAYTKLVKFDLREGVDSSFVSAKPNGYGDSLTNWSDNLTKIAARYNYDNNWTLHGSLIYYWGFDGTEDRANFKTDKQLAEDPGSTPPIDDRSDQIFNRNVYLNLGAEYNFNKDITVGINGHNLLGLISKTYNKRNYFLADDGVYRLQAPSLSVAVNWHYQ